MTVDLRGLRRSPLGGPLVTGSVQAVRLHELPWRTLIELRIATAPDGSGAQTGAVESALGLELPSAGLASSDGDRLAVWLGPGWWLLDEPESGAAAAGGMEAFEAPIVQLLRAAGGPTSAVDVSAGFAVLELAGPRAAAVLAHGCSIDLHPRVFGPVRAARTMVAKAQVVLAQTGGVVPTYRIWVRSSFARYLAEWLLDAMTEYR
ncbi:MAG: sarcosine oxidase subunit gamma [Geodermatophilaceae bacterium]|nr:sarcosine oxidase subunit gamma [Geodermatophilaceae bacterium]